MDDPLMPRCAVIDDFLDPALHQALLRHALDHRGQFVAARVGSEGQGAVDETRRRVLHLSDLGVLHAPLSDAFRSAADEFAARLGTTLPGDLTLEMEITACGDGAHFVAHQDIEMGPKPSKAAASPRHRRLMSAVYYFHRQPQGFSGGALRLLSFDESSEASRDIAPNDNRLVAFLSWARHEVRPVRCPSGAFEDYRFGLNCWFRAPIG